MMFTLLTSLALAQSTWSTDELVERSQEDTLVLGVWGRPEANELRAAGVQGEILVVSGRGGLEEALEDAGGGCGYLLRRPSPGSWSATEVCVTAAPEVADDAPAASSDEDLSVDDLLVGLLPPEDEPSASAPSTPPPGLEELLELPDHAARRDFLLEALSDSETAPEDLPRLSSALAVVNALDEQGRDDSFVTKLFLQAALSSDAAQREAAVSAAREGGDPPMGVAATTQQSTSQDTQAADTQVEGLSGAALSSARASYKRQRLRVVPTGSGYLVVDGMGRELDTETLLRKAGRTHEAQLQRLAADRTKTQGLVLLVTGVGTTLVGGMTYAAADKWYGSINSPGVRAGTTMMLTGPALALGGGLAAVNAIGKSKPHRVYSQSAAQRLVNSANARIQRELGLSSEDLKGL